MDKYIPLKYVDNNSEKICKLFKPVDYIPSYKTMKCPISVHNQTNHKTYASRGVYKITCHSEQHHTIYNTDRTFTKILKKHNNAYNNNPAFKI